MNTQEIKIMTVRECTEAYSCHSPNDIRKLWDTEITKSSWFQTDKEMFIVILLNARNNILGYNLVTLGLADSSLVHPREVFRPAIINSASGIIVVHNHPSGNTTPSSEDIRITKQLIEASKIIDIKILDHVIIGTTTTSLRESGICTF
jgi:DNA repair protein RadC